MTAVGAIAVALKSGLGVADGLLGILSFTGDEAGHDWETESLKAKEGVKCEEVGSGAWEKRGAEFGVWIETKTETKREGVRQSKGTEVGERTATAKMRGETGVRLRQRERKLEAVQEYLRHNAAHGDKWHVVLGQHRFDTARACQCRIGRYSQPPIRRIAYMAPRLASAHSHAHRRHPLAPSTASPSQTSSSSTSSTSPSPDPNFYPFAAHSYSAASSTISPETLLTSSTRPLLPHLLEFFHLNYHRPAPVLPSNPTPLSKQNNPKLLLQRKPNPLMHPRQLPCLPLPIHP